VNTRSPSKVGDADGSEEPRGLEFPCDYPLKAMGRREASFREVVVRIVEEHVGPVTPEQVRERQSSAGAFQSVTVTVRVESRSALEAIYQDLADCEAVLWTL